MLVHGPLPDESSRLLRLFDRPECFLRVRFADEDGSRASFDPDMDLTLVQRSRFGDCLRDGITVAGRRFHWVAYAMSSLREHAVLFVTPFVDVNGAEINADTIRDRLGDFSALNLVP